MITRKSLASCYLMGSLVIVLLALTAGAGVITRAAIYAPFLSASLVAFQFFQDLLSLVLAPCLAAAMYFTHRGSLRAFAIWAGLLVYVLYYYAFYVFDPAYTVYYPLYIALIGLCTFSLIGLFTAVDLRAFAARMAERVPARFIAIVLFTTILFVPIWLMMMAQGIAAQQPPETFLVFVFDLAFLLPACIYTAVQTWRRRPIGFVLAGPLLIKAALSGVLLFGGELQKTQLGLPLAPEQLGMYLFLAAFGSLGLALYLRHLDAGCGASAAHREPPMASARTTSQSSSA